MIVKEIPQAHGSPTVWLFVSVLMCVLWLGLAGIARAGDAAPPRTSHLVRQGETLYSLSRRYGVPLAALMAENGITSPEKLAVGKRLSIPAGQRPARPGSRAVKNEKASPAILRADWKPTEEKCEVMGIPREPAPAASGPLAEIPLRHGATLSPEHRDPGAVIMSGAADRKEDFQGHALGVMTKVPAGKDTQFVTTLGYGVRATVDKDDASSIGYKTDTNIDGLGYGLGLRHSF